MAAAVEAQDECQSQRHRDDHRFHRLYLSISAPLASWFETILPPGGNRDRCRWAARRRKRGCDDLPRTAPGPPAGSLTAPGFIRVDASSGEIPQGCHRWLRRCRGTAPNGDDHRAVDQTCQDLTTPARSAPVCHRLFSLLRPKKSPIRLPVRDSGGSAPGFSSPPGPYRRIWSVFRSRTRRNGRSWRCVSPGRTS